MDLHAQILYLENCTIPDETLAKIIGLMIKATKLKRVFLVKMILGPNTVASLTKLNHSKTT